MCFIGAIWSVKCRSDVKPNQKKEDWLSVCLTILGLSRPRSWGARRYHQRFRFQFVYIDLRHRRHPIQLYSRHWRTGLRRPRMGHTRSKPGKLEWRRPIVCTYGKLRCQSTRNRRHPNVEAHDWVWRETRQDHQRLQSVRSPRYRPQYKLSESEGLRGDHDVGALWFRHSREAYPYTLEGIEKNVCVWHHTTYLRHVSTVHFI